jgi:hypothetical protein
MSGESAERRAAARDRRRKGSDEKPDAEPNGVGTHETAAQAARAAAAAAAVGAALGAVRALTSRGERDDLDDDTRGDDAHGDERGEREDDEHEGGEREQDLAAAGPEPTGERSQRDERPPVHEPRAESRQRDEPKRPTRKERPRKGAAAGTVRSIVARAREQLRELQGREPESVTALEQIDGGWRVTCEVVELERIPNSTDVLATYVVELDGAGELLQYERVRRYYRAQSDLGGDE